MGNATIKEVTTDVIVTMYFDNIDTSQMHDPKSKVTSLRKGGESIKMRFHTLQTVGRDIQFQCPKPMGCEANIQKYNSMMQEDIEFLVFWMDLIIILTRFRRASFKFNLPLE